MGLGTQAHVVAGGLVLYNLGLNMVGECSDKVHTPTVIK